MKRVEVRGRKPLLWQFGNDDFNANAGGRAKRVPNLRASLAVGAVTSVGRRAVPVLRNAPLVSQGSHRTGHYRVAIWRRADRPG